MIVYISIVNTLNILQAGAWDAYVQDIADAVSDASIDDERVRTDDAGATWIAELFDRDVPLLKAQVRDIAVEHGQNEIVWAVATPKKLTAAELVDRG